jgi:hypothetical protein
VGFSLCQYQCGYCNESDISDGDADTDEDRHYLDASLAKGKCLLHPMLKVPLSQNQVIFHAGIAIWLF